MNNEAPSHGDLLDAIGGLRKDIRPLVEMQAELNEVLEIMRAFKAGGKGVKWIASIATALLAIGGLILAVKALWQGFWGGTA
jgi:cytochrome b subunit of formate dehydrogenase